MHNVYAEINKTIELLAWPRGATAPL